MNISILAGLFSFFGGCSTHHSAVAEMNIAVDNPKLYAEGLPKEQTGCGWVVVSESSSMKVLGVTVDSYVRQFDEALFYCCPGESKPEPLCHRAKWLLH